MVPIADRVVALWSHDLHSDCRRFLKGLDPEFFRLSSNALAQIEGGRHELFAAAHIFTSLQPPAAHVWGHQTLLEQRGC